MIVGSRYGFGGSKNAAILLFFIPRPWIHGKFNMAAIIEHFEKFKMASTIGAKP